MLSATTRRIPLLTSALRQLSPASSSLSLVDSSRIRRGFATDDALSLTALDLFHQEYGGKMVPFAGYSLPVFYESLPHGAKGGIVAEHLHTRATDCASIFDVSHMGQIIWRGEDRIKFLEQVLVGDVAALKPGEGMLSLITNDEGGILDDTVLSNSESGDYVYMVVNGACKHKDMKHFKEQLSSFSGDCTMEYLPDTHSLLALQGPASSSAMSSLLNGASLTQMSFMTGHLENCTVAGVSGCKVTRCGYTGEDGFEISIPQESAVEVAEAMLALPGVNLAGLGARDSLRLEAGLCLYGNDLDETTTPIEGGLAWTMGKPTSRRRTEQGFLGADKFLTPEGKLRKTVRKRVGISGMKAPAREDTPVYDAAGENRIGVITSGTFSPSLKKPLAMGYVESGHSKKGTEIMLEIRGKMKPAVVEPMPFVECNYYRAPE